MADEETTGTDNTADDVALRPASNADNTVDQIFGRHMRSIAIGMQRRYLVAHFQTNLPNLKMH